VQWPPKSASEVWPLPGPPPGPPPSFAMGGASSGLPGPPPGPPPAANLPRTTTMGRGEGGSTKRLVVVLFNDTLLLAEHQTFGGKLQAFHGGWWLPEEVEGARGGEPPGTLHVRRAASGETLTFVVSPPAEADDWLGDLQRVSSALQSGREQRSASFHPGGRAAASSSAQAGGKVGGKADKAATAAAAKGGGILAGWLQKKGGGGADGSARNWAKGGRRNWKWRWVVVSNTQFISWFDSEKCKELKGSLALHGAQVWNRPDGFHPPPHPNPSPPPVPVLISVPRPRLAPPSRPPPGIHL
jgi:hypothetical protein